MRQLIMGKRKSHWTRLIRWRWIGGEAGRNAVSKFQFVVTWNGRREREKERLIAGMDGGREEFCFMQFVSIDDDHGD